MPFSPTRFTEETDDPTVSLPLEIPVERNRTEKRRFLVGVTFFFFGVAIDYSNTGEGDEFSV
jgi:hypothetical protein